MNQNPGSGTGGSGRLSQIVSYVLIFLMMTCFAMTVGNLIQNNLPEWHSEIVVGVTLFIVIDRLYTYQRFKSLTPLTPEWGITFGSQWFVITVFVKVLLSYANGSDSFVADLARYSRGDLEGLINPEFGVTMLLAIISWYLTGEFLRLLDETGLDQIIAIRESATPVKSGVTSHQRLANLMVGLGIALVILTALARIDFRSLFLNAAGISNTNPNQFSGGEVGTLLYFLFGLALLSQSRLMSLQVRWDQQRVPVSSNNLAGRWSTYSLVFIVLLMIVIGLLPAGDSLGFFSLLGTFLGFLFNILFFIGQLFLNLVYLLFSLPFLLLGKAPPTQIIITPTPTPTPEPATDIAAQATYNPIWALLKSIVLWGALATIITFAVVQFVRQHGGLVETFRKLPFTNWIIRAWQSLRGNLTRTTAAISRAMADGWENIRSRLEGNRILPRLNLLRLRSLDPRRQVYFFYLAMVRRSGEQGLDRKPSQTPAEYANKLEKALPTVDEDVRAVTESFIKARYSRVKVESEEANIIKTTWGRIRQALQELNKPGK